MHVPTNSWSKAFASRIWSCDMTIWLLNCTAQTESCGVQKGFQGGGAHSVSRWGARSRFSGGNKCLNLPECSIHDLLG